MDNEVDLYDGDDVWHDGVGSRLVKEDDVEKASDDAREAIRRSAVWKFIVVVLVTFSFVVCGRAGGCWELCCFTFSSIYVLAVGC